MPIYEYHCAACRRRVSLLIKSLANPDPAVCPRCGGHDLTRLFSRFAFLRSEEERLERLADPGTLGDLDEDDPQSVARWAKRMGKELGEDLGDDFDQAVEEAMEEETAGAAEGGAGDGDS